MGGIETVEKGVRFSPLAGNHDVAARLVPEIVAKRRRSLLPVSLHLQSLSVDENKPAWRRTTKVKNNNIILYSGTSE